MEAEDEEEEGEEALRERPEWICSTNEQHAIYSFVGELCDCFSRLIEWRAF